MPSPETHVLNVARAQDLVNNRQFERGAALALTLFDEQRNETTDTGALARRVFARAQLGLGGIAYELGDVALKDACLSKACAAMEKAVEFYRRPANDGTFMLPDALEEYALLLARSERLSESRILLEESLMILTAADKAEGKHWSKATTRLSNTQMSLLSFLKECDHEADRVPLIDQMIEVGFRHSPINQNIAALYSEKAQSLAEQGRREEAIENYGLSAEMFSRLEMDEAARVEYQNQRDLQT